MGKRDLDSSQPMFVFDEPTVEVHLPADEQRKAGYLATLGKMKALLDRVPACSGKTRIREKIEEFDSENRAGLGWESLEKEVERLYWFLCFPSSHTREAGFHELLPIFSAKSINRLQDLIGRLEDFNKNRKMDGEHLFRFKAISEKAARLSREDGEKIELWDWHELLWAVEDLYLDVTGGVPTSEGVEKEPGIFRDAEKKKLTNLLAELGEIVGGMTPGQTKGYEDILCRFNAVQTVGGTDSMWMLLLDAIEVFFEECTTPYCDLKNQLWGVPGEWFIDLSDGQRVLVTYEPSRFSLRRLGTMDHFGYRGEISETGFQADYPFRDTEVDIVEFSRARAEEFRAKFKKECSHSSALSKLRAEAKNRESVFDSWTAKFDAQQSVLGEIREQVAGLQMEQRELLRLVQDEVGVNEQQLTAIEAAMKKRFPEWSLNRRT